MNSSDLENKFINTSAIKLINILIKNNIKVNHIITDPPYNISRQNNFKTIKRAGIDFGSWDKKFNQFKWLTKINSVVRPGGSVIIFNDWKNLGQIANYLSKKNFLIKDFIRWVKPAPMPRNVNRRYVSDSEYALWVVKPGAKWVFNKDKEKHYLRPEIKGSTVMGKKRIHPTQKSPNAILQLLKTHVNAEEVVLDPFTGSGEICIQSKKFGAKFIGCEINNDYFLKIQEREEINNSNFFFNLRPVYNHLGNKFCLLNQILKFISKNTKIIEVFSGTGIISINSINKQVWINDIKEISEINKLILTDFNLIKKMEEVNKEYLTHGERKENYKKLRKSYNIKKSPLILLLLIINSFNQQVRFNSKGEYNVPLGKQYLNQNVLKKIKSIQDRVKNKRIKITAIDFRIIIARIIKSENKKEVIIYLDPPYFLSSNAYSKEWKESDERDLYYWLDLLNKAGFKFIISNLMKTKNKTNKFLEKFINENNFTIIKVDKSYSNSNYQRKKTYSDDFEVLVKNY